MANLELRIEPSGPRHFLTGKPVHVGCTLEVQLPDGRWAPGRYEWSFRADERAKLITSRGEVELSALPIRWPPSRRIANPRLAQRALALATELRDRAGRWREIAQDLAASTEEEATQLLRTKWCDDWGAEPPPPEEFLRYAEAHDAAAALLERVTREATGAFRVLRLDEPKSAAGG